MKPPGGQSHDLWGAEFKGTPCHHRVLKPPGGGSSDIFGPADAVRSPRRARSHLQSSVFGPASASASTAASTAAAASAAANGDATPRSKPDGNPVTGEGYTNGDKQPAPVPNGTDGPPHSAPAQRPRVPPGGFSSGLW